MIPTSKMIAVLAATCSLVVAAVADTPGATGSLQKTRTITLSNERTLSRWANANEIAPIRRAPSAGARTFAHLHYFTEDGFPEVYLALKERIDRRGGDWVLIRVPMRPNGTTGWVTRASLGNLQVVHTSLTINRGRLRATLYRNGKAVWNAPVGVGKPGTVTPAGHFYIRDKFASSDPFYGPVAFATSAYGFVTDWPQGGVVGIHGTSLPGLVPGRISHGCVRIRNAAALRLAALMPVGTPVHVI